MIHTSDIQGEKLAQCDIFQARTSVFPVYI